ncbi:hypothetical protein K493DRAFT_297843 [Basidiobolus meristosporus CBS 931.73]|uniref:Voltage-gated hydrogen channel 1 n=1 Tax=Basidiobolus meristosporus CBS 931.73 TaxID=1314790 RepID=A0A1Y1YXH6_9FUNG|nr:hypothetical protein K493DRAFT_297843 [Basidiobolus meristosporus CBS 931.73]|eukprot:ORY02636.1 hypothetical protein K493DRAFT_297843 [Basidiobolus meristosporus CBS 931.73]
MSRLTTTEIAAVDTLSSFTVDLEITILIELVLSLYESEGILRNRHVLNVGKQTLFAIGISILSMFMLEIVLKLLFMGIRHFLNFWQMLDLIVVSASFILEIYFHTIRSTSNRAASGVIILFRFWKILRVIHAVAHSVEIKNLRIITAVNLEKVRMEKRIHIYKSKYKDLQRAYNQLRVELDASQSSHKE